AHARQHRAAGGHLLAVEPDALGQAQPQLEPALAGGLAVVVADALDPHAAEGRILGLRQDDGVLDGHARLVVVAVHHPLRQLQARELPGVHEVVVAVVVVVALLALAADPLDELLARQRGTRLAAHNRTSMPSSATSQPAAVTAARWGESSR